LRHHSGTRVAERYEPVNLRDFIAEVRFYNPYDSAEHRWDWGLLFRDIGPVQQYRLVFHSDQTWTLSYGTAPAFATGRLSNLRVAANEPNDVRLIVQGKTAFVFLNGTYVAALDVAGSLRPGSIDVGTGIFLHDMVPGRMTRYENLSIWAVTT
jgi:hypothetical protein